ncbi:hypothetical protein LguiA_032628 [Lonicera macranthoides]
MAGSALLHLLVTLLALSHFFSFNAQSTLGTRHWFHQGQDNSHKQQHRIALEAAEEELIKGRMDLENKFEQNDYDRTGANDHHTPKEPPLRT